MNLQAYRDAILAEFTVLKNNPPSRKQLLSLEQDGFTPQDVVDYYRWSEDVTGVHGSVFNRERMFRVRQRVVLRNEASFDEHRADMIDIIRERMIRARKRVPVNPSWP